MAVRVVNGNTSTEDGWPLVDKDGCTWITVPGADVHLQIQSGVPARVLGAWVADWNAYVEPVYEDDSASWTEGNSVLGQPGENNGSNHLGGTAVDVRWQSHPWKVRNGGLNAAQLATIADMLDWYEGCIWWGGNWPDAYVDPMHSQLGSLSSGDLATYANGGPTPHILDFIARKIRADGFSTFRRDNVPVPPPPAPVLSRADGYAVKIIQEGQRRNITPRGIEIALATGLVESNLTIYANAKVPASMDIPHDAVGSDGYSVGIFQQQVRDTGNGWWWGDAATCMDPTSSAGLFYSRLVTHDYNGPNSPGSYAQAVQSSAFPDRYDQRFNDAVAIYNRLANTTTDPGDDWMSDPAALQMLTELYDEYRKEKRGSSRSFMVPDGNPVDSPLGFLWNIDGNVENINITLGYLFGTTLAEEFVNTVASTGVAPASWAGNVNQEWLQQYGQQWCLGLISFRAAIQKAFQATGAVQPTVVNNNTAPAVPQVVNASISPADVQNIADRTAAAINQMAPPATVVSTEVATAEDTTGDKIQRAVDSNMDYTDHVLAMDAAQRTALTRALQSIDPSTNGVQA